MDNETTRISLKIMKWVTIIEPFAKCRLNPSETIIITIIITSINICYVKELIS